MAKCVLCKEKEAKYYNPKKPDQGVCKTCFTKMKNLRTMTKGSKGYSKANYYSGKKYSGYGDKYSKGKYSKYY